MTPYFETGDIQIYQGDAREVLSSLDVEATACVTDPPYGLGDEPDPADVMRAWADGMDPDVGGGGFMGEDWDSFVPAPNTFEAIYDSLLPGAPMLCFAGSRTADWMGMSLRFAGFERRDTIQYLFGSGFPKSLAIGKAIDDAKGAEREDLGPNPNAVGRSYNKTGGNYGNDHEEDRAEQDRITAPVTGEAETWDGYGTALAPAHEPVILAMKPKDGTFAENALKHGTAGLNIDGARVETDEDTSRPQGKDIKGGNWSGDGGSSELTTGGHNGKGRWPANVVLDEAAAELVDAKNGATVSEGGRETKVTGYGGGKFGGEHEVVGTNPGYGDEGGPSRFFYTAKASKSDRNAGLPPGEENDHPTVKPTDLMGWLLRLVEMPERNLILDPFCGSGTTLYVAQQMGLPAIGIDQDEESCELASKRLSEPSLFS